MFRCLVVYLFESRQLVQQGLHIDLFHTVVLVLTRAHKIFAAQNRLFIQLVAINARPIHLRDLLPFALLFGHAFDVML